MPNWKASNDGRLEISWTSKEDFLAFLNNFVVPEGKKMGLDVSFKQVEPPKLLTEKL